MKKIIFTLSAMVAVLAVTVFVAPSQSQAQAVCPTGFTCTNISTVACPLGFTCTPIQTPNCPAGYICDSTKGGGISPTSFSSSSATVGSPIIYQNTIIGYPVTFNFTLTAGTKGFYISRRSDEAVEVVTYKTNLEMNSDLTANPSSLAADNEARYFVPPGTSRSFSVTGTARYAGFTGLSSLTLNRVYYGETPQEVTNLTKYIDVAFRNVRATIIWDASNIRPSITLLTPNHGEIIPQNSTYMITWRSNDLRSTVTIGLKRCPSCMEWLASNVPNTGSYQWNVSSTYPSYVGSTYKVFIVGSSPLNGGSSFDDESDGLFSIVPSYITASSSTTTATSMITNAVATIGAPVISSNKIVAYAVNFQFNVNATQNTLYFNPNLAFTFANLGNGSTSIDPRYVTANPTTLAGDQNVDSFNGYYVVPAGTSRTFSAWTTLRNNTGVSGLVSVKVDSIGLSANSSMYPLTQVYVGLSGLKATAYLESTSTASTTAGSVSVSAPYNGASWQLGSSQNIYFRLSPVGIKEDIYLVSASCPNNKECTHPIFIGAGGTMLSSGDTTWGWTVGQVTDSANITAGSYMIKICLTGSSTCSFSPAFNITSNGSPVASGIVSTIDAASPLPSFVQISKSAITQSVALAVFDVKSIGKAATLRNLNFILNTTGAQPGSLFSSLSVRAGGLTYAATNIGMSGTFTNMSIPLPADTYVPITVLANIPADTAGALNNASVSVGLTGNSSNIVAYDSNNNIVPVNSMNLQASKITFMDGGAGFAVASNLQAQLGAPVVMQNTTVAYAAYFQFTLTAGNAPVYVSPTGLVSIATVNGATWNSQDVTPNPFTMSGDTSSYYFIPAGTSRTFTVNGAIRAPGAPALRVVQVSAINYGSSPTALTANTITSGLTSLKLTPILGDSNMNLSPTASFTIEGQKSYTYTVGQTNHYAWSSTNADSFSSSYTSTGPATCGSGPWVANTSSGSSASVMGSQYVGCVWTVTYVAKNTSNGQQAASTVVVSVADKTPIPTPIPPATVSPASLSKTIQLGDSVQQVFVVNEAMAGSWSSWTIGKGGAPSGVSVSQYGAFSGQLQWTPTAAGSYTFVVDGYNPTTGSTVSANIYINVLPRSTPAPTATFTIEGAHSYTYTVGQTNHYVWSATNADQFSSSYTSTGPATCGSGPWVANSASGQSSSLLGAQYAGCVWTVTYTARNSSTGQSASDTVTVSVIAAPSNLAPQNNNASAVYDAILANIAAWKAAHGE